MRKKIILSAISLTFVFQSSGFAASLPVANPMVDQPQASVCQMDLSKTNSYWAYLFLDQNRVPPECLPGVIDRLTSKLAFFLVRDGRVPNGYEQEVWAKVDWVSLEPFEARQLVFHNRVPEKYESLIMDKSNAFVPGCREFQYWLESGYLDSSAPLCLHR